MKSAREHLDDLLNENSFSAAGSRTPGSRTNPILAGYVKSSPELSDLMVGSRMNEIASFASFHGYDQNLLREIAEEALAKGRVPDLSNRVPDTYDKATIALFISDVMLNIGEDIAPKQTEEVIEESLYDRLGLEEPEAEIVDESLEEQQQGSIESMVALTGSKAGAGVSRDLNSVFRGDDLSAISTGGRSFKEIYLQPNHLYFMEEQGQNRLVLVTGVRDSGVRFYGESFRVERTMNRGEANDRIFKGTVEYLETTESRCHPRLVESFDKMLNRKRSPLRHLIDECRRVRVTVKKADGFSSRDLYHDATQYGIVEEIEGGYSILVERSKLHHIKKSRLFTVKDIEEGLDGLGCVLGEEKSYYEKHLQESAEEAVTKVEVFEEFTGNTDAIHDVLAEAVKSLDAVGKEDGDVDNDGDEDSSDKYLKRRRGKIKNAIKGREVKEGLEPSVEKGLIVREAALAKAREFAVKGSQDQHNWVWSESGDENFARSRELMGAVRQSSDWWAHHYHQYLWCCSESIVNKLSESKDSIDEDRVVQKRSLPKILKNAKRIDVYSLSNSFSGNTVTPESGSQWDRLKKEIEEKSKSDWPPKIYREGNKVVVSVHQNLRYNIYESEVVSADGDGEVMNEAMDYHHVSVSSPDGYDRIRTVTFGKGIKARIGFTKGESSKPVSLLFPKGKYSHAEAKDWAKKHAYKIVKSMKAEGKTWENLAAGSLVEAYKNNLPGKVVAVKGELAQLEWANDYDGPNIVHLSRLRLQGKQEPRRALPQPHIKESRGDIEPTDPFLDTLLEHPCYGGNSFSQAMGIMEHKPDNGDFKSPIYDIEERVVFDPDPGIRDPRIEDANEDVFASIDREDEFFSESNDPNNDFTSSFWGVSDVNETLRG